MVAVSPHSVRIVNITEPLKLGESRKLSCEVVGANPKPTIVWRINSKIYPEAFVKVLQLLEHKSDNISTVS